MFYCVFLLIIQLILIRINSLGSTRNLISWNDKINSSSSSLCCNWCDPVSVVSADYDSRFAWLLLIQQSRPALKLLTVFALTTSLDKLFHKLADRLKKKYSRWTCFVISLWYLKRWPLVWFCWTAMFLFVSNYAIENFVQLYHVSSLPPFR